MSLGLVGLGCRVEGLVGLEVCGVLRVLGFLAGREEPGIQSLRFEDVWDNP